MSEEEQQAQQDRGGEERCHGPHNDGATIPRRDGREPRRREEVDDDE